MTTCTETEFINYVKNGDIDSLKKLSNAVNFINSRDQESNVPVLQFATFRGCDEIVKFLLELGCDINAKDSLEMSALHKAVYKNQIETLKILLSYKPNMNIMSRNFGTPLHLAAYFGFAEELQLLVSSGADVNAVDFEGKKPIEIAIEFSRTKCREILEGQKN